MLQKLIKGDQNKKVEKIVKEKKYQAYIYYLVLENSLNMVPKKLPDTVVEDAYYLRYTFITRSFYNELMTMKNIFY